MWLPGLLKSNIYTVHHSHKAFSGRTLKKKTTYIKAIETYSSIDFKELCFFSSEKRSGAVGRENSSYTISVYKIQATVRIMLRVKEHVVMQSSSVPSIIVFF